MPELIDRAETLQKLCAACSDQGSFACISCVILHIIKDIPTSETEPVRNGHWISCIERLPEPLQNVIVCTDINTVTVAWLNGDHWTFADTGNGHTENWSFDAVKYWMYLPEPPEGEQNQNRR